MEPVLTRTALLLLIVFKFVIIAFFGPLMQPDSLGYITFADTMLSLDGWWFDRPNTLGEDAFRVIGYPALIALAKLIFGDTAWAYAILVVQAAVGTLAAIMVYLFARQALGNWRWGFLIAAAYVTSQAVVYDLHILTDSLYGHGLAILLAILGLQGLLQQPGRVTLCVAAGLLVGLFLLREFTLFLLPVFVPLITVAVWPVVRRPALCAAVCIAVLLPMVLTAILYTNWNAFRSGDRFVTTAARKAALLPLVQLEGRGIAVFGGDSVLDQAARENLSSYFYADVININRTLSEFGVSGVEMSAMARGLYLETLVAHPLAFLRHATGEIRLDRRAKALANPITSFRDLEAFRAGNERMSFSKRLSGALDVKTVSAIGPVIVEGFIILAMLVIGVFAFLVFPVAYLARLAIRCSAPVPWTVQAGIWASCGGTMAAYSLIRLEDRYLIGFTPFMIIIGLFTIRALWRLKSGPE